MEIELELTYLVKNIPADLKDYPSMELVDIYIPETSEHPHLRIRKRGDKMEITKKVPIKGTDSSEQHEFTIDLWPDEFEALSKMPGKRVKKIRYFYPVGDRTAEVDIFQEDLEGLVVADFEFKTVEEKSSFIKPDFCGDEVTQDRLLAGGFLAGKKFDDIAQELKSKYNFLPLSV